MVYGSACLGTARMRAEFQRYGMDGQRRAVGLLQWLAAAGLLAGLWQPWMGQAAAAGLALMMLVATAVRWRINDSLQQTLPALLYLGLTAYLCLKGFGA